MPARRRSIAAGDPGCEEHEQCERDQSSGGGAGTRAMEGTESWAESVSIYAVDPIGWSNGPRAK